MKTWLTELKKGDFVLLISEYKTKITKKERKENHILKDMIDYNITRTQVTDIKYKKDNSIAYIRIKGGQTFTDTGKAKNNNDYCYYYLRELTIKSAKRYNSINYRNQYLNTVLKTNFNHLSTNQLKEIEKIILFGWQLKKEMLYLI